MIRALFYDPSEGRLRDGGPELIDAWERIGDSLIWVLIEGEASDVEQALLAERFRVHPLAMSDALRDRHPPKIEDFEKSTFLLLKGLDTASTSIDLKTIQLSMFIGERFLVSRSATHSVSAAKVLQEMLDGVLPPDLPRGALALRVCRTAADRFVPILLGVEKRLEEMEVEMIQEPNDALLEELMKQKGDLRRALRILQYHAQIFATAVARKPQQLGAHEHELIDVQDQFDRLLGLTRLYYDLTDDLTTGYLSLSAHRLNQIMQTLTIVTVVFVPITFMAGIYGMNFDFMPELGFRGAYFILLGSMALVVATVLHFFRRKGWIGSRDKV